MATSVDPDFKSSLPPRKRAKTQEEKEQRRVERILRNRRAAHASREKKRKHVEFLEAYVLALEKNFALVQNNFARVSDLVPRDQLPKDLALPDDLSELKARIHSNLVMPVPSGSSQDFSQSNTGSMSENDQEQDDDEEASHAQPLVSIKREMVDDSYRLASAQSLGYFNYMSPVSINSPVNSPIDLKIKQEAFSSPSLSYSHAPNMAHTNSAFTHMPPTLGPEFLAQNPAAVLYSESLHI